MIIVINLLRNIFVIMFIILLILEIIVLISLTTLYGFPLKSNLQQIKEATQNNTNQILESFNFLLVRKYYNLATELLFIAKHNFPMYLTLNQNALNPAQYPSFIDGTAFINSYKNSQCLVSFLDNNKKRVNGKTIYSEIIDGPDALYSTGTESTIISAAFANPFIDNLVSFPESATGFVNSNPNYKTYLCYAVSMLKTLFVRNMIFERKYPLITRYMLFLQNKYLFMYPADKLDDQIVRNFPYYKDNCDLRVNLTGCFTTFDKVIADVGTNSNIFFDTPIYVKGVGYGKNA